MLDMSNETTAVYMRDFTISFESPVLVIPGNFSGYYRMCVNITIFGNDMFDGYQSIVLVNVTARSPFDRVTTSLLVVNIAEDDGTCSSR